MSYNRTPNTVLAGRGLKQSPSQSGVTPVGVVTVTVDGDIATTSSLGFVQVGSGLSITPLGVLSATNSGTDIITVTLTAVDYTALLTDYYIGATKKDIEITLPLGVVGKVYVIKNQASGNIKVEGTAGQKLDTSSSKTLGSESAIICVFDGTRWNII
jgi:hypothetical protein